MKQLLRVIHALMVAAVLAGCAVSGNMSRPVALVIGNGAYNAQIPELPNPESDAEAIAERMRSNGFSTVLLVDATREEMLQTLQAFGKMAVGAPLAIVYYSGHGVETNGRNLLLPVDFRLEDASNLAKLEEHSVPLTEVGNLVSGRAGGTLIFLDACRNDPTLPETADTKTRRLPYIAGVGAGLGDQSLPAATVVYATEPGKAALDGTGPFSPFTMSFLRFVDRQASFNARVVGVYAPFLPLLRLSVADMTRGLEVPTWRGPQFPATRGYNTTPAPQVQEIIAKSNPNQTATSSIYGVPSTPVKLAPRGVQLCWVGTKEQSGNVSKKLITTQNSTLCGDILIPPPATFNLVEKPKHGRVVFDDQVFGYIPRRGYKGEDAFAFKVYYPGGSDITVPISVSVVHRTTIRIR